MNIWYLQVVFYSCFLIYDFTCALAAEAETAVKVLWSSANPKIRFWLRENDGYMVKISATFPPLYFHAPNICQYRFHSGAVKNQPSC